MHLDSMVTQSVIDGVENGSGHGNGARLPDSFDPEGITRAPRLEVLDSYVGHLGSGRDDVVDEVGIERLSIHVEGEIFEEGRSDPLSHSPMDLTVHDLVVQQRTTVVHDDVVEDLDLTGLGVDGNLGHMSAIGERDRFGNEMRRRREAVTRGVGLAALG